MSVKGMDNLMLEGPGIPPGTKPTIGDHTARVDVFTARGSVAANVG
jgi:hypothetical protein